MRLVINKKFRNINKLFKKIINEINSYYRSFLCEFYLHKLYKKKKLSKNQVSYKISAIVFSKDRAMQLHALLNSFFDTKIGECNINVIYYYSNELHKKSYNQLRLFFRNKVNFIAENNCESFQLCLKKVIDKIPNGKIFFLVDDIIFTETVDYGFLSSLDLSKIIFSLRMGLHLRYSYVVDSPQPLPENFIQDNFLLRWKWSNGKLDWGYPLSVDGHIFMIDDVSVWVNYLHFNSPSSFESALQKLKHVYHFKDGMSFTKARIVNIPANKVQSEVDNYHGSIHQDKLLELWLDGKAIDYKKFRGWSNTSVHEEANFNFIKRESIV